MACDQPRHYWRAAIQLPDAGASVWKIKSLEMIRSVSEGHKIDFSKKAPVIVGYKSKLSGLV